MPHRPIGSLVKLCKLQDHPVISLLGKCAIFTKQDWRPVEPHPDSSVRPETAETWLLNNVLDSVFQPRGFSVYHSDRLRGSTSKTKGWGVFLLMRTGAQTMLLWIKPAPATLNVYFLNVVPFISLWSFWVIFLCAAYIHLQLTLHLLLATYRWHNA